LMGGKGFEFENLIYSNLYGEKLVDKQDSNFNFWIGEGGSKVGVTLTDGRVSEKSWQDDTEPILKRLGRRLHLW
jgi:hypothetical protein